MATEFINGQWRIPNDWNVDQSNQDKISNYSMEFDGVSNQEILVGSSTDVNLGVVFTFSAWIKPNSWTGFDAVYSGGPSSSGYIGSTGSVFALREAGQGNAREYALPPTNSWTHICLVRTALTTTGIKMYYNGVEQTASASNETYNVDFTSSEYYIGNDRASQADYNGKIDQVCIFDYALSQPQVTTLYGNSAAGYFQIGNPMALTPNPVAFYPLGDQDLIGAGYNGANWLIPNQVATSLSSYVFSFTTTGSAQRINIPSITIGAEFTTSFWFNSSININDQLMAGDDSGTTRNYPFITIEPAGMNIIIGDSSGNSILQSSVAFVVNDWFHIAIVQSSGTATLYINGNQEATAASKFPNVTLIANRLNGTFGLEGEMSNIAFLNTPLPATGPQSIASLYNGGTPPDLTYYSNLLRWYRLNSDDTFDGTDWTIKDSVSSSNNGTSVNMSASSLVISDLPNAAAGYSPYAIDLNGTDEIFTVDNSSGDLNVEYLTFSIWVKPNTGSLSGYQTLIGNRYQGGGYYSYGIQIAPGGRIRYLQNNPGSGPYRFSIDLVIEDQWNHVAVANDPTNGITIYINGGAGYAIGFSSPIEYPANPPYDYLTIGGGRSTSSFQFVDGQLSNAALWDGGLSAANVATIYNNGIPGDISSLNPLAWWELGSMMGFNGVDTYTALSNTNTNYAAVSSANMAGTNVVNGPGYLNGGSGTSSLVIKEQAPYSFNNALSENMAISNRDDSQASDPRPFIMQLNLIAEASSFVFQTGTVQFASYPYTVNWGDGSIERILDATQLVSFKLQHTYDTDTYPRPVIEITTTPEDRKSVV